MIKYIRNYVDIMMFVF